MGLIIPLVLGHIAAIDLLTEANRYFLTPGGDSDWLWSSTDISPGAITKVEMLLTCRDNFS